MWRFSQRGRLSITNGEISGENVDRTIALNRFTSHHKRDVCKSQFKRGKEIEPRKLNSPESPVRYRATHVPGFVWAQTRRLQEFVAPRKYLNYIPCHMPTFQFFKSPPWNPWELSIPLRMYCSQITSLCWTLFVSIYDYEFGISYLWQ